MQKLSSDLFINAYGNSSTSGTEQDSDMAIASKNVFTDIGCTIKAPMQTIYVNGTKVGPRGAKVDYSTTDACKVAKIASADGFSYNSKGNLIVSKPSGDAAKVQIRYEKNNSRIKITLPKKLNGGTTAYFIVSYSANAYKVYQISMS